MTRAELAARIALMASKRQITASHVVEATGAERRKIQHTLKELCAVGVLELVKTQCKCKFYRVNHEQI